jgi:hypothetical protein
VVATRETLTQATADAQAARDDFLDALHRSQRATASRA